LFILYGVAHKLAPALKTTGVNVHQFCLAGNKGPTLAPAKIRSKLRELVRDMRTLNSLGTIRAVRKELQARAGVYHPQDFLISGKDYLLPLLRTHLAGHLGFQGSLETLKARLAGFYEVAGEPFLARRLRSIVK